MTVVAFLGSDPNIGDDPFWVVLSVGVIFFITLFVVIVLKTIWSSTSGSSVKPKPYTSGTSVYVPVGPPRTTSERVKAFIRICLIIGVIFGLLAGLQALGTYISQTSRQRRTEEARKAWRQCLDNYSQYSYDEQRQRCRDIDPALNMRLMP